MLEFNLCEKKTLLSFSYKQGSIIFLGSVGGGGPWDLFALRVDVGLLFVILLCESELEIQRKEGGRLPLDSRKLLNHLEKKGGGPDPPLIEKTQNSKVVTLMNDCNLVICTHDSNMYRKNVKQDRECFNNKHGSCIR